MSSGITKSALAKVGVELIDRGNLHLGCMICGHDWKIKQGADTRRPDHYRECKVCNPGVFGKDRKARRRQLPFNNPFGVLRRVA